MRRPPASAWVVFAVVALGCKGHLIDSHLLPPPGPPPTTTPALALRVGGPTADQITAEALDPTGNIYVAGTFTGSALFNPAGSSGALTSLGGADGFLAKYSSTGGLVWAVRFGGTGGETVTSLARDNSGNLYVGGGFEGTAIFGDGGGAPSLLSEGGEDGFVAKVSGDGAFVWARRFGGASSEEVKDVAVDASGNAYAVGSFADRADALPAGGAGLVSSGGGSDGFVLSFDPSGTVRWAFAVGGTDTDEALAVRVTAGGVVAVAGTFRGSADFAPGAAISGLSSQGGSDVFLAGYTTGGTLLWARGFGGPQDESVAPGGLAADAGGGVALIGAFSGSVDFDPGPTLVVRTSIGTSDLYAVRFDGNGTFQSVLSVGGTGTVGAAHAAFASDGNLLVSGAFSGSIDFDPGTGTRSLTGLGGGGGTDAFVAKYTPAGTLVWVSRFGDAATGAGKANAATAVASDAAGAVYVGGVFFGTPNFDPGSGSARLSSLGDADGFLVKLTASGALAVP